MKQKLNTFEGSAPILFNFEGAGGAQDQGSKIPTFEMRAYTGKAVRQPWSELALVIDLEGLTIPDRSIPIRMNHSRDEGVGHTTSVQLVKSSDGLVELAAEGVVSRVTQAARDVVESAKQGFPWQASITAPIYELEHVRDGDKVVVNGREFHGPISVARKSELAEISVLDLGADDDSQTTIAASGDAGNTGNERNEMRNAPGNGAGTDAGAGENTNTDNAGSNPSVEAAANIAALSGKVSTGARGALDSMLDTAKLEAQRQGTIRAAAEDLAAKRPELASDIHKAALSAIDSRMDGDAFALEMMRLGRDIPGMGSPRHDQQSGSPQMIEAALAISGGMQVGALEKFYAPETLQAAEDRFGRGLGLQDVIMLAAREHGFTGLSVRSDIAGALRAAFGPDGTGHRAQLGFSSVDLPTILSNVANKHLRVGFMHVEPAWSEIAAIGSNKDFKQKSTVALVGDYTFKKIGKSGEIEHAKPGELSYTSQIETFARMLAITRQDIINDDLSALTTAPQRLGRGGGLAHRTDFWTVFQDDASFFSVGNSNLKTGTASALSATSLTAAETAYAALNDPDGNKLGVEPRILLVHPANRNTAFQLMNSTEVRGDTGVFGTANPHRGRYKIVVSNYVAVSTHWWLLADPMDIPVIESSFLNGMQQPTVETAEADFNQLGIRMRGYFDFGNDRQEFRGGVKSTGVA